MSTTSIETEAPEVERSRSEQVRRTAPEPWASLAIAAMWVAVAPSAIFGPDFVSTSPGGSSTTIPSGDRGRPVRRHRDALRREGRIRPP